MMLPITSDVAQAALAWLGTATIKVSALLLVAFAVTRWRGTSAATRHAIWATAIVTAVAVPIGQLSLPAWEVGVLPAVQRATWRASVAPVEPVAPAEPVAPVEPLAPVEPVEPLARSDVATFSATTIAHSSANSEPSVASDDAVTEFPVPDDKVLYIVDPDEDAVELPVARFAMRTPLRWPFIALAIWLLGAVIVCAPWVLGVRRRNNLWRGAAVDLAADWKNAWRYIPTSVEREIRVRTSDLTTVPMTWGAFAPVILTPRAPHWTAAERRAALLHELAHIARFDTVWQGISRVMMVLFWFNPLAWIADAMLRAESERACDDAVLRAGTRASEYAQQLLDVLRSSGERGMPAVAAMSMARRSGMAERLRALLDAGQERGRLPRRLRLSLVALSGVVAVPIARLTPVPAEAAVPTSLVVSSQRVTLTPATTADAASASRAATSVLAPTSTLLTDSQPATAEFESAAKSFPTVLGVAVTPVLSDAPVVRSLMTATQPQTRLDALATPSLPSGFAQGEDCLNMRRSASSSMHNESKNGRLKTTQVKWSGGDCRLTFDLEGDITLNADATDVVGLSRGGSLDLVVKDGSHSRRVQLEEKNGTIDRQYWVDGDRKTWDADAAAWFTSALVALDRRTAFAADQRLPLILKKGGVEAALTEIEQMYSDYAQRIYYTKLFKLQPLSIAQIRRVLAHVGSSLSSDYERAELLLAIAKLDVFREEAYVDFANAASG
ncbi:MAG: M56 family metallopeptidase, partial [Gemmatimonadaceae bacterium]